MRGQEVFPEMGEAHAAAQALQEWDVQYDVPTIPELLSRQTHWMQAIIQ